MVSALDSEASGLGSSPGNEHRVVFLDKKYKQVVCMRSKMLYTFLKYLSSFQKYSTF